MRKFRIPSSPSPSTRPSANSHSTSFRSPLSHILPKHALFRVKLQIHELSNVPLLGGEFGVKWRFKHVQSAGPNASLLAKMKLSKSSLHVDTGKGKGRDLSVDDGDLTPVDDDFQTNNGALGPGINTDGFRTPSSGSYSPASISKSSASSLYTTTTPDSSSFNTTPPHSASSISSDHSYSDGRGATEWAPLHEHTAEWQHTVSVIVRMDIDRETSTLQSNDLKLTVMQVR
jgi:N-terminal C2 in EEIG1 and EHBP1 proteins